MDRQTRKPPPQHFAGIQHFLYSGLNFLETPDLIPKVATTVQGKRVTLCPTVARRSSPISNHIFAILKPIESFLDGTKRNSKDTPGKLGDLLANLLPVQMLAQKNFQNKKIQETLRALWIFAELSTRHGRRQQSLSPVIIPIGIR